MKVFCMSRKHNRRNSWEKARDAAMKIDTQSHAPKAQLESHYLLYAFDLVKGRCVVLGCTHRHGGETVFVATCVFVS